MRKSRGRGGAEDDAFGGGEGGWQPPPDFGAAPPRYSGRAASSPGQESQAVVKWFNAEKGFGFVEVSDGGGDAFLHASALERAGAKVVEPGAVLRVRIGPGPKGLQVTEVLEVSAGGPAGASAPSRARNVHLPASQGEGEEVQGVVKWYDAAKGFGFITPVQGGKDVFVHATSLERSGLRALAEGQSVRMRVVQGRKGPEVSTVSSE
jgi:CspA family cold shock protein